MDGFGWFLGGAFCMFVLVATFSPKYGEKIEQACQGKPLVIQESLITKTLTCEVKLKEKK